MTFYQNLIGDKDIAAIDKYLAKDFIQHNPNMLDGKDALKKAFSSDFDFGYSIIWAQF